MADQKVEIKEEETGTADYVSTPSTVRAASPPPTMGAAEAIQHRIHEVGAPALRQIYAQQASPVYGSLATAADKSLQDSLATEHITMPQRRSRLLFSCS